MNLSLVQSDLGISSNQTRGATFFGGEVTVAQDEMSEVPARIKILGSKIPLELGGTDERIPLKPCGAKIRRAVSLRFRFAVWSVASLQFGLSLNRVPSTCVSPQASAAQF
jgi:hypothetical protein